MKLRPLAVMAAAAAVALLPMTPATASNPVLGPPQATYYLALGDSLARGVQPNPSGKSIMTHQGYVDDLYAAYHAQDPNLRLVDLGCPGERTDTMADGGVCPSGWYASYGGARTQLQAAVNFLEAHKGKVALVTIDIGANNVDVCVTGGVVDSGCVGKGANDAVNDLHDTIMPALRQADPSGLIVGMTYYDPFLAAWLEPGIPGPSGYTLGQLTALGSLDLSDKFNAGLAWAYGVSKAKVADVSGAFRTDDTQSDASTGLPIDVETICALTWMCAPAPTGPNIHANAAGYHVIAGAFEQAIGTSLP